MHDWPVHDSTVAPAALMLTYHGLYQYGTPVEWVLQVLPMKSLCKFGVGITCTCCIDSVAWEAGKGAGRQRSSLESDFNPPFQALPLLRRFAKTWSEV